MTNEQIIICRSCLRSKGEMINLFLDAFEDCDVPLFECYNLVTGLKLDNDDDNGMPVTICEECITEMRMAFNFRVKCEKSEKILRNHIIRSEADSNYEEMVIEVLSEEADYVNIPVVKKESNVDDENNSPEETESWIENSDDNESKEIYLDEQESHEIDKDELDDPNDEQNVEHRVCESIKKTEIIIEEEEEENQEQEEDECKKEIKVNRKFLNEKNTSTNSVIVSQKTASFSLYKCEQCIRQFRSKDTFEMHMKTVHNGKNPLQQKGQQEFECMFCEKKYFSKNSLARHEIIHSTKRIQTNFLCAICGKSFTTAQRLRVHTLIHTGEKNYHCDVCDKSFLTEFRLRHHQRTHTGERPYQCQECGHTFAQSNALKCHSRLHTGEKPYACKFCNKRFTQNSILKTHLTLHTGKTVKCPDCDKKFSRASNLILHRREHTGEKPYICDLCPNRYKQKSHLDRHMDTHMGIKHECEMCGKTYSKRYSLKMHMFVHLDTKPFNCNICSMAFTRKNRFKAHMKTHGEIEEVDKKEIIID